MARETYADLVLTNARVLTMRRGAIESGYVAVRGDRIVGLGGIEGVKRLKGPRTREMDCQGMALLPGFNDAHCHLMALASSLRGVGCRRDKVSSIAQIAQAIRQRATRDPSREMDKGIWLRRVLPGRETPPHPMGPGPGCPLPSRAPRPPHRPCYGAE